MTAQLHFGVLDISYVGEGGKTTGDVAEILEAKYGIMEAFYGLYQSRIEAAVGNAFEGAMESIAMGRPAPDSLEGIFAPACSEIEAMFREFLSTKQIESLGIEGVPTKAALHGVNHRFNRPYAKRGPRPSFIDTGQYEASMKAWVGEGEDG